MVLPPQPEAGAGRHGQAAAGAALGHDRRRQPKVALAVGVAISGALGPVAFAVDGLGLTLDMLFEPGNAGPLSVQIGLRPPSGLGLAINASIVSGGGFIAYDEAAGRYFGVFAGAGRAGERDRDRHARHPPARRPAGLLAVRDAGGPVLRDPARLRVHAHRPRRGARRQPPLRHRRAARAASPAAPSVGSSPRRTRSATRPLLLGELGAIFPPAQGVFVVGPTVQLTWINVVRADLGIFIELPGPTKIVLLGVVRVALRDGGGRRAGAATALRHPRGARLRQGDPVVRRGTGRTRPCSRCSPSPAGSRSG